MQILFAMLQEKNNNDPNINTGAKGLVIAFYILQLLDRIGNHLIYARMYTGHLWIRTKNFV